MPRVLLLALLLWCLAGAAGEAWSQGAEQPVPPPSGRVVDLAGALGATQRTALEDKLERYERQSGPQIVVLIVATTQPEDIAAYAQRVADRWKIGRRDVGDGLLIVVAKDDRKVRIEVAKALEGAVPDLAARQIIDAAIKPAFKAGDYAGGLNQAIDRLQARIAGEHLPAPQRQARPDPGGVGSTSGLDFEGLGMLLFLGVPIAAMLLTGLLGRKFGSLATAGAAGAAGWTLGGSAAIAGIAAVAALVLVGVLGIGAARGGRGGGARLAGVRDQRYRRGGAGVVVPPIIWGGGGFGGGGSGGAGGFSSGGGGDFGGGGASGDW